MEILINSCTLDKNENGLITVENQSKQSVKLWRLNWNQGLILVKIGLNTNSQTIGSLNLKGDIRCMARV